MSRSNDVLVGLTPEQANAAAPTGPVLALAGAGTGKTKTLIACGGAPDRGKRHSGAAYPRCYLHQ
jgi:hypothetical protein